MEVAVREKFPFKKPEQGSVSTNTTIILLKWWNHHRMITQDWFLRHCPAMYYGQNKYKCKTEIRILAGWAAPDFWLGASHAAHVQQQPITVATQRAGIMFGHQKSQTTIVRKQCFIKERLTINTDWRTQKTVGSNTPATTKMYHSMDQ